MPSLHPTLPRAVVDSNHQIPVRKQLGRAFAPQPTGQCRMKSVVFLGKRETKGSPKQQWPDADLWGTTHSYTRYLKRCGPIDDWDEWFDLHPFNRVPGYIGIKERRPDTFLWYQQLPGPSQPRYRPLWLAELDPSIKAGKRFPTEEVLAAFPEHKNWFICQTDLMMAYAILRGYEHIILHGHGMKFETSHMLDHVGMLVWMAVARERGIYVEIVGKSWYLGQAKPYGVSLDGWTPIRPGKVA